MERIWLDRGKVGFVFFILLSSINALTLAAPKPYYVRYPKHLLAMI